MQRKILLILSVFLVSAAATGFFLYRRFQEDREAARAFRGFTDRRPFTTTETQPTRTTKTYTAKELEEARKHGKLPQGAQPNTPANAATENEAAVQRTLRTIDEINRVNEMNRRLQEQQDRMQRQK